MRRSWASTPGGPRRGPARPRPLLALLLLAGTLSSCAYYNTFYLARKYYDKATAGQPYSLEKGDPTALQNYSRSIDYSKKVIAAYPKSKWVDDAYLLWARALIGRDDPLLAKDLLAGFPTRFPNSHLQPEAKFYLGVAQRQSRRYEEAVKSVDTFLVAAPKNDLVPYAYLERARALMALERPAEAAQSASEVVDRFPKSRLRDLALKTRAEARFATRDFDRARADFNALGLRSQNDDERFDYLLRESDCLEGARKYDEALELLRDARSHETRPALTDTSAAAAVAAASTPSMSRFGRLQLRIGSVHLLAGKLDDALQDYREVLRSYPRTLLAAEAQYRTGYAYEVGGEDFDKAREAYAKVKDQQAGSAFSLQAAQRTEYLERVASYRSAGGDSLDRRVEADFLLAELYLFEHEKPERALEEYAKIVREYPGTPYAGKALNAEAWLLRSKLDQPARADSLLWSVVYQYPRTEAQLAARDYLERGGHDVPDSLIQLPEPPTPPEPPPSLADSVTLTPPPAGSMPLGPRPAAPDSLGRLSGMRPGLVGGPAPGAPPSPFVGPMAPEAPPPRVAADTVRALRDSLRTRIDSLGAVGDTARAVPPVVLPPRSPRIDPR